MKLNNELNYSSDFSIECLGEQELDVYDIEVEDNHNFFGNDVLLHNSIFIDLSKIVKKKFRDNTPEYEERREFLKQFCNKGVYPVIAGYYQEMVDTFNLKKNTYEMDFEVIADKSIFVAKKKYVMNKTHFDGYDYPEGESELKITGIEIVRSSTPMVVRDFLQKFVYKMINTMDHDTLVTDLADFKEEFKSMNFGQIARPTGVKGVNEYKLGQKSLPIHVRAALVYNKALKDMNLKAEQPISEGEKIRYCYIKQPNIFGENVIACIGQPPQAILDNIEIDIEMQWKKVVLSPIESFFNIFDWETEVMTTLDELF